jgi:general secretion pathway protein L
LLRPNRPANTPSGSRFGRPSAISRWLDARLNDTAEMLARLTESFGRRRRLLFIEQSDGSFAPSGKRDGTASLQFRTNKFDSERPIGNWRRAIIEFRLAPRRFVFRELELPARAGDLLDGVVRAQIDRIMPWRASEAVFGCGVPSPREGNRIAVTVAACKSGPITELAGAAAARGADAVSVTTTKEDESSPIKIYERRIGAAARLGRWRFALLALLGLTMTAGVAAIAAQWTIGADLLVKIDALNASVSQRRAALLRLQHAGDDPASQALDRAKRKTPSAMIVLDALSKALPDDAYLTEMRLEGDKLVIAGVAHDAAKLIQDMEQSPSFSQATFTAPTTRAPEDRGESFRIEAHVAAQLAAVK